MIYKAFKKDSKGKIRVISFHAEGTRLVQRSGLVDGALVEHIKECKPKNIGRANFTTAEAQAEKEAIAKWEKKLRGGYFKLEEDCKNEIITPMLASDYKKVKHKIKWPCWVQPKLDSMRCLAFCQGATVVLRSRDNNVIQTVPHIYEALRKANLNCILDGELYAHGLGFQENMKLIKKDRPESIQIKYHVYDQISDESFKDRSDALKLIPTSAETYIPRVSKWLVKNIEDVKKWHSTFTQQGYEGLMIRWGDEGYHKNKRSQNLVKYKEFDDMALPIIDIKPMDAKPECGMVICDMNGVEVKATPKMSREAREELLTNKHEYIGMIGEIRYFGFTDDGNLRFPVCVGMRLDKYTAG